ncbi:hypothetical protein GWI33_004979 [Rhynchophorus ferrugineus]|uniref:Uncharacterized protein n=1 Tax=Rhynchophorus ferrugineus TaxID=354439 RepID=A0A834INS6_RHYFE|nr:hypothetical protein GWI33_004979 [Rhynchophorus ferrugineus]
MQMQQPRRMFSVASVGCYHQLVPHPSRRKNNDLSDKLRKIESPPGGVLHIHKRSIKLLFVVLTSIHTASDKDYSETILAVPE